MNQLLAIPFELRLAMLFLLGVAVGSLINWGVYRLAWRQRSISPFSRAEPAAPARRWSDRIPIIGWLGLRRESKVHGAGFWIRPLILEIATGVLFAGLYWWEVGPEQFKEQYLMAPILLRTLPDGLLQVPDLQTALHVRFAAHLILISLMMVAAFIDIDEKTIPDTITITGVLIGLILAATYPGTLLTEVYEIPNGPGQSPIGVVPGKNFSKVVTVLTFASPNAIPRELGPAPKPWSLALGVGCYLLWCFALLDRRFNGTRGWKIGFRILIRRATRGWTFKLILLMAVMGSAGIFLVWQSAGDGWFGLLTALVGMAIASSMIWAVRIIGSVTLKKEAMGFGDVTLMAMIGAFMGWQAFLMIFFIAPFAGLVIALAQWFLNRNHEIPYGPFLCLGTLVVMVLWAAIWHWAESIFLVGWLVPSLIVGCLVAMFMMLGSYRLILQKLGRWK